MTVDMGGACSCHQLPMNTYWVGHGRFLAGEYPGASDPTEAAYKLRILLNAGIRRFIDLTEPYEGLKPYAEIAAEEARRLGTTVEYSRHSIVDLDVPHSARDTAEILDVIDEAVSAGKAVYVHCWGWRRQDRHGGRLLAGASRPHGRAGPRADRHMVDGHGEGVPHPALARNAAPTQVRAQLERASRRGDG